MVESVIIARNKFLKPVSLVEQIWEIIHDLSLEWCDMAI